MSYKFKKGEKVIVTVGKNKGSAGVVEKVFRKDNKVIVSGANLVTKHVKPSQAYPNGAILKMEKPIHASNVMHVDPKAGVPTRVGFRIEDGKKVKFSKKSNEIITV